MKIVKPMSFSLAVFFAAIFISSQTASGVTVFQGDTSNSIVGDNNNNSAPGGPTLYCHASSFVKKRGAFLRPSGFIIDR